MISATATRYLRERWIMPGGRTILAPLPQGIEGHFGPELRRFALMQYHRGQSTMRWLGESEQSDKWFPCLKSALMPRSRREHVETITA